MEGFKLAEGEALGALAVASLEGEAEAGVERSVFGEEDG